MLTTVFLICAVVGGALVLAQVLLSVLAAGMGRGLHLRAGHGAAVAVHRPGVGRGGLRFRLGTRVHTPRGGRLGRSGKPVGGHRLAAGAIRGHWVVSWVQGMFNFQGIVAGATVLGLVGLAATAAKMPAREAVAIAIAAAMVMMALVERVFELMLRMESDGTIEIQQAVGKPATVYLGIPARNEGQGKITISLQERQMEFPAITFGESPLATGQKVVVVNVVDPSVMVVVSESKYSSV